MDFVKEHKIIFGFIFVVILASGIYTWSVISKNRNATTEISPAMRSLSVSGDDTPYTDLNGNSVSLSDFVGQVLVVNSWASWSPASVNELKTLSVITNEYKDSSVKVIAINRGEPANTAKSFLQTYSISEDVMLVLDYDDRYFASIGGYNMPETVVYDTKGNIFHHERGAMSESKLRRIISQAMAIQ
ncbi:TlpA family protein disulfide reductase [Candidatus Nomurabacteria bacterium]|nr:TlpA family protein disulfide reductase [Candidatus Kaiserbacteria bacterium]MCB9810201.1 TlpA family protein disulfide reductase [Candidatus Nomurabacteria bacterium]MCB9818151.1 TlpA family protein disulfide reductase [Candidatus Nomurabacteria bacterium]